MKKLTVKKETTKNEEMTDMAKKMTLSISDRLNFPSLLPSQGKIVEMEIVRNLKERVKLTPAEIEEYEVRDISRGGFASVIWDGKKAKDREFRFENSEIEIIQKGIKKLDQDGEIQESNLDLAKKFKAIKIEKKEE